MYETLKKMKMDKDTTKIGKRSNIRNSTMMNQEVKHKEEKCKEEELKERI